MGGVWIRFLEPHRVNRLLQQRSPGGGGGEVIRVSSDGDDRVGAKIKTPKNP